MTDLITLDEYKALEGISSNQHDARTNVIIDSVSQLVKTYCGNGFLDFFSTPKIETISLDYNTSTVQLTESPVNTITTVTERERLGATPTALTESTDFLLDKATDTLYRVSGANYKAWAQGVNAIVVTYTAGWATTPADLQLAVADLVTYYLRGEHKERKTLQGGSIQNQQSDITFPDHIKRVLDLYKQTL